jgi:hypothetical protein
MRGRTRPYGDDGDGDGSDRYADVASSPLEEEVSSPIRLDVGKVNGFDVLSDSVGILVDVAMHFGRVEADEVGTKLLIASVSIFVRVV